jgi:hypothetical protein
MERELMTQASLQIIDNSIIAGLVEDSKASERKRSHLLLHSGHDDQVQRLLIALSPERTCDRTIILSNGKCWFYSAAAVACCPSAKVVACLAG